MKRLIRIILIILLIALVAIQFIRPNKNNGGYDSIVEFEKETKPSTQVASLLKENCYDCHSNQSQYPWYSQIAPISFFMAEHIKEGKEELNLSNWKTYSLKKKDHKLEELIEMVEEHEMPLESYTWIHGDLREQDRSLLIQWATMARLHIK